MVLDSRSVALAKKIMRLAEDVNSPPPAKAELAYLNKFMCYASLPHSDTGLSSYKRVVLFGDVSIKIYMHSEYGIPYGIWARRLLAYVCQQAILYKKKDIFLGKTQSDFLRNIRREEIMSSGGKRGYLTSIKEQAKRLFTSTLKIESNHSHQWSFNNSTFAEEGAFFENENGSKNSGAWSGYITLSDSLFKDIINNSVPIEMCVVQQLQSSLTFDLYIWLRWKKFYTKKEIHISWDQLFVQFGFGYQQNSLGKRDFKKKAKQSFAVLSACKSLLNFQIVYETKKYLILRFY